MRQVLAVSRSGYYAWVGRPVSAQAQRRARRRDQIRRAHQASRGRYGSPKIAAQLRRDGERIAVKTVARVMQALGLRSCVARRYKATTQSAHGFPVAENVLAQQFTADRRHAVWMADITYSTPSKLL